jgi:hypothetical protein
MGANAQTSVPAFVTGQVLTAQQQTEINTGIPVFAAGTYGRVGIIGKNSSTTQSTDFTLTCSSAFSAGRLDFYGYAKA